MPVGYTWAEWLQTSALEALSYSASLPVPCIAAALQAAAAAAPRGADTASSSEAADSAQNALGPDAGSWEKLLVQLLQFDAAREFQLFQEVCIVAVCPIFVATRILPLQCLSGYSSL